MRSRRKRNGDKKHGRNAVKCQVYRRRAYTNKLHKLRAHLAVHPADGNAIRALELHKRTI